MTLQGQEPTITSPENEPGMFGTVTARASAQVLRLSLIYALLDAASRIRREHLEAALEVWRYCEDSARFIFGSIGDPTVDVILEALRCSGGGLTRTEIFRGIFNGHGSNSEIERALMVLHRTGLARFEKAPAPPAALSSVGLPC